MVKYFLTIFIFTGLQLFAESFHIHIISGAKEYKATESMKLYKVELEKKFDVKITHTATVDKSKELPNMQELKKADLLIVYSRRLQVQKKELKILKDYLISGKPLIGVRTASHAFQTFLELDKEYFGGSYKGHDKLFETSMTVHPKYKDHEILKGVDVAGWTRKDKPYYNNNNAMDTKLLINGSANNKTHPMAWTRVRNEQRIFYTSMGLHDDFKDQRFVKMMNNAVLWVSRNKVQVK